MNALEVQGLQKSFGEHQVLKEVTFQARTGRMLGFIGKNGAGKTTTMKILTGLMASDGGDVFISGNKVPGGLGYKGFPIGYLPDVPVFYSHMQPLEYLTLCAEIMGKEKREIPQISGELLELVGLGGVKKRIGTFSRGMKQRLGMAQALMGEPELLICDEPTSALDPLGRREILQLLAQVKERTTVIFSTHVLSDVEQVCDDIAVLDGGKILYCGELEDLKEQMATTTLTLKLRYHRQTEMLQKVVAESLPQTDPQRKNGGLTLALPVVETEQEEIIQRLWAIFRAEETVLESYQLAEPSLEDIFVEMIK